MVKTITRNSILMNITIRKCLRCKHTWSEGGDYVAPDTRLFRKCPNCGSRINIPVLL